MAEHWIGICAIVDEAENEFCESVSRLAKEMINNKKHKQKITNFYGFAIFDREFLPDNISRNNDTLDCSACSCT